MRLFSNLFGSKSSPLPQATDPHEKARALAGPLIVYSFRSILAQAPAISQALTDENILGIFVRTSKAFRAISIQRREQRAVSVDQLAKISIYFMTVFVETGAQFFEEHFQYELDKYLREGLRETYREPLVLFPPSQVSQETSAFLLSSLGIN